jgi:hypothetical protein
MAHYPQCVQKYNTKGIEQVRQNIKERSPKLKWHTLYLKNKTKTKQINKIKTQGKNEGCLPQALSLMSSARLTLHRELLRVPKVFPNFPPRMSWNQSHVSLRELKIKFLGVADSRERNS